MTLFSTERHYVGLAYSTKRECEDDTVRAHRRYPEFWRIPAKQYTHHTGVVRDIDIYFGDERVCWRSIRAGLPTRPHIQTVNI